MSLGRKGEDDYRITIIFEKDGKFAGSVVRDDFHYTCEKLVSNDYYILDEHDRGRILDDIDEIKTKTLRVFPDDTNDSVRLKIVEGE